MSIESPAPPPAPPASASASAPIVWSSQVTHTAMAIIGQELFNATYTASGGGSSVYVLGTVFAIDNGQVRVFEPKHKRELGTFADEHAARAACESFCRGEIQPPESAPAPTLPSVSGGGPTPGEPATGSS